MEPIRRRNLSRHQPRLAALLALWLATLIGAAAAIEVPASQPPSVPAAPTAPDSRSDAAAATTPDAVNAAMAAAAPDAQDTDRARSTPGLDANDAWRSSQTALGRTIADYTLLDRRGQPVRLAGYRGKPLLVSFIYTGCFQICPANTRALNETVQALQKRFGTHRFNVVSIGFNQPVDTPQAMKSFAAQQRIDSPDWEFLSPHPAIVERLTADFGFRWRATPAGFDHVLQLSVLDPDGRLVRQIYGDRPATAQLGELLQRLFDGATPPEPTRFEALFDRVRLLCTIYDPVTGTDRVDYALAIEIAGGITFVLAMLAYGANEWWTQHRARRLTRRKPSAVTVAQTVID